jgi:ComF family protein
VEPGLRSGGHRPRATTAQRVLTHARDTIDGLLAAVLAAPCVVCERITEQPTRGAACEACWTTIRFITPPYCTSCGEPFPSDRALATAPRHTIATGPSSTMIHPAEIRRHCARCAACPPVVDVARALGAYADTLRELVHALKYEGRRSVAPRLAALVREHCRAVLAGADAVVPVPLHRRREWTRGFNQADAIAGGLGLPVWRLLRRTRHTDPQSTLAAPERRRNVHGAFAVRRGTWSSWRQTVLSGACLVLVDDVSTTGATLDACAEVLKAGGAREVRALTVARAILGHTV